MINYWAVLVSAVLAMVIGAVWWGTLFGKLWAKENGFPNPTPEQKAEMNMGMLYAQQFILSLIQAAVLACVLIKFGQHGAMAGIKYSALLWLGFMAPINYGGKLWGNKSYKLTFITLLNSLITMVVMGAVIGAWYFY